MPLFRYEATDASGRLRDGVLDALTQNELVQRLSSSGLRVHRVELAGGASPPAAAPPPMTQTPYSQPTPVRSASAPSPPKSAGATYRPPRRRTLPMWNKGLALFFVQLSNLLRSGISITEALESFARRQSGGQMKKVSEELARATASGTPFSDAMESYPDIFQPGAVGAIRAGEKGGYLQEACHTLSEQTKSTWKLALFFWPMRGVIIAVTVTFLIAFVGIGTIRGGLITINTGEASGPAMTEGALQVLQGPTGIFFGILFLIIFGTEIYFWTTHSRPLRHKLARVLPFIGRRTRGECLSIFTWHLSSLAKAGISPWQSFNLAADAVPNMDFSKRLKDSVRHPGDQASLSLMLYQSGMIPQEYAAMIETGEMTGTAPQALDDTSKMTIEDSQYAERNLKVRAGCWALLLMFGGGMIAFLLMYNGYIRSAFEILDPFK